MAAPARSALSYRAPMSASPVLVDPSVPEVPYSLSASARAALARLGRTEDLRFSPDLGRLAIAGFHSQRILILSLRSGPAQPARVLELDDPLEITTPGLAYPHGLAWADDRTLVVADRGGAVHVLPLPAEPIRDRELHRELCVAPLVSLDPSRFELLAAPGSVALVPVGRDWVEALVCNNDSHRVSQHLLDRAHGFELLASSVLLSGDLGLPDGISCSADGRWIAVSSHQKHRVLVYPRNATLDLDARPAAVLRGVRFPHGTVFAGDGGALFVASAGEPVVQVYRREGPSWQGELDPARTLRVMDEATFRRGHVRSDEGGPKGIDVDPERALLACTCEAQPLRFFAIGDLVDALGVDAPRCAPARPANGSGGAEREAVLRRHLRGQERTRGLVATHYVAPLEELMASRSWRFTAPLRWARQGLGRLLDRDGGS